MSDAQSVPGMTVRAVTNENIELERAVTDKNGMAVFFATKFSQRKTQAPSFSLPIPQADRRSNLPMARPIHHQVVGDPRRRENHMPKSLLIAISTGLGRS